MPDRFSESGTKTLRSMSVYTKPRKQRSDTISCQTNFIKSTIIVVFFACFPSNRFTLFALKLSYYQSKVCVRFVSDYNVYTSNKTVPIVLDPFSYHLLMRSRVVPDFRGRAYRIDAEPYKRNPNPIEEGSIRCTFQFGGQGRVNNNIQFINIGRVGDKKFQRIATKNRGGVEGWVATKFRFFMLLARQKMPL